MKPALFSKVGNMLAGPMFRKAVAAWLGVTDKTIGRWKSGRNVTGIPVWVTPDLARVCREHADRLLEMATHLDAIAQQEGQAEHDPAK